MALVPPLIRLQAYIVDDQLHTLCFCRISSHRQSSYPTHFTIERMLNSLKWVNFRMHIKEIRSFPKHLAKLFWLSVSLKNNVLFDDARLLNVNGPLLQGFLYLPRYWQTANRQGHAIQFSRLSKPLRKRNASPTKLTGDCVYLISLDKQLMHTSLCSRKCHPEPYKSP